MILFERPRGSRARARKIRSGELSESWRITSYVNWWEDNFLVFLEVSGRDIILLYYYDDV